MHAAMRDDHAACRLSTAGAEKACAAAVLANLRPNGLGDARVEDLEPAEHARVSQALGGRRTTGHWCITATATIGGRAGATHHKRSSECAHMIVPAPMHANSTVVSRFSACHGVHAQAAGNHVRDTRGWWPIAGR